jgi:hypothetical protein
MPKRPANIKGTVSGTLRAAASSKRGAGSTPALPPVSTLCHNFDRRRKTPAQKPIFPKTPNQHAGPAKPP